MNVKLGKKINRFQSHASLRNSSKWTPSGYIVQQVFKEGLRNSFLLQLHSVNHSYNLLYSYTHSLNSFNVTLFHNSSYNSCTNEHAFSIVYQNKIVAEVL